MYEDTAFRDDLWDAGVQALFDALTALDEGRLADARALGERAAHDLVEAVGEDHPDYGRALRILGSVAAALGQTEEANVLFTRALARFTPYPEDPIVREMARENELAIARRAIHEGQFREAEEVLRCLLQEVDAEPGGRDPALVTLWNDLGICRRRAGRFAEAGEAYAR